MADGVAEKLIETLCFFNSNPAVELQFNIYLQKTALLR